MKGPALGAFTIVLACTMPTVAGAQPTPPATQPATQPAVQPTDSGYDDSGYDAHLDAGLAHYEARRYAEAAASFRAAFDRRPEPDLMYNVARSLERALAREDAIAAYDQFLQLPGTTSEMRARARDARDSLRRELEAIRAPDPVVPDPEPVQPTAVQRPDPPLPEPPSSPLRPVAWSLPGLGAAAAIVRALFVGLALSANADF